ncbi:UNVERIFIED_CONTAM: pilus assembly protein CpaE [Acetivibrio alkalicellulosi]
MSKTESFKKYTPLEEKGKGEMVVICSAKGGVGKTVVSTNLAVALSKKKYKVALLDGDFQFGDLNVALNVIPNFTIKEAAEGLQFLDESTINTYLTSHLSGIKLLAAPEAPEYADLITPVALKKIYSVLLEEYDFVIVDTGVGLEEKTLQIIEDAHHIWIMSNLDITSIKNTRLMLDTLEKLQLGGKSKLIINNTSEVVIVGEKEAEDSIGKSIFSSLPYDDKTVTQSINYGTPFVLDSNYKKSIITKRVMNLATYISGKSNVDLKENIQSSKLSFFTDKIKKMTARSDINESITENRK